MEYMRVDKPWEESIENGNIEQALKRIEYQIAVNLLNVHNMFSDKKMTAPVEVYSYIKYGSGVGKESEENFKPFISFDYDFIEIGHGLDNGSNCPKEDVLNDYKELEIALEEAMSKL